ncbi:hypothetical protein BaRGS_00023887 [Batillaria attramentaria]|uniref:Uncharacterized protein n=1 Tax=Batillaria attramentaria TaxID=370345 RepID=A0ABD0KCL0_9CAEN
MVFVSEMEPTFHQHPDGHKNPSSFSWAMYFALVSSLLAIIASIAIACNNPPQTRQTPTGPSEFDGVASFGASAVNSFPMNVQGGGVFPTRNQSNDYPFRENRGGSSIPTGTRGGSSYPTGLLGGNPFPTQGCGSFPGGVQSGGFQTAPVYAVPGQGGNSSNQGPSPSSSVFMGSNILQGAPTQALSGQGGDIMQAAPEYASTNLSGMYTALSASALYASESSTTVPAERNISGPGNGYAVPSAPPYYL